jgi:hypothetical protein
MLVKYSLNWRRPLECSNPPSARISLPVSQDAQRTHRSSCNSSSGLDDTLPRPPTWTSCVHCMPMPAVSTYTWLSGSVWSMIKMARRENALAQSLLGHASLRPALGCARASSQTRQARHGMAWFGRPDGRPSRVRHCLLNKNCIK